MRFSDYLKMAISSFVPRKYRRLTAHKSSVIIQTYFVSILFILSLMILISIPKLIMLPSEFSDRANSFDKLTISLDVLTSGPVELTHSPKIIVDLERDNRSDEYALLNNQGITFNKFLWFGETHTSWNELQSVSDNAQTYSKLFTILAILLIPSLIVTLFMIILLESALVGAITWTILFLATRSKKFRINNKQLSKIITLSLIPFLAIQIIPLAYIRWFIVPFIFFILLLAATTWLVGENRFEHKK